jgi:hypothetical protein
LTNSSLELDAWIEHVSGRGWTWYLKYLSANDTYAKPNVHQGGPYLAKELLRAAFPATTLRADSESNPDLTVPVRVASHGLSQDIRLIWYNSRRFFEQKNGRDEARLTNWGGREHPLVAEDATGSLVSFAFYQSDITRDAEHCELWITRNVAEEDAILEVVGPIDPGANLVFAPALAAAPSVDSPPSISSCALAPHEMLHEWRDALPSGDAILKMVLSRQAKARNFAVDARLLKRRECEYQLFRSIENHVVLPRVKEGFATVDEFVSYAHSVTNRRMSRSGKSLELQVKQIFDEENVQYDWTKTTEDKRTPDFIFPSIAHYRDGSWPSEKLRMLATKTTCKDRWRQVLNEAARIGEKHLLTLQEGVSEPQFREMTQEGIRLVVPSGLHAKYPESVQPKIVSLEQFVAEVQQIE